ncbi:MAG: MBL fold metallo-hydrolase [Patescibacteria group bacterium]|jgi:L-ascorbate metabolism protein UlaG (beta-lactamase superfamily)
MKITKHAQSCLLIETSHSRILVDPGKFVFEDEKLSPNSFDEIDLLVVTHEHPDHFDYENIKEIIQNNSGLKILSTSSVVGIIANDYPDVNAKVIGDGIDWEFDGFKIRGSISKHGPLPNGNRPPVVSGFLIVENDTKKTFYDPGDTVVLDPTAKAEIIAAPICGKVVMDISQAKSELKKLMPKNVIPIHYDNSVFPVKVKDFQIAMENSGIEVITLAWGQTFEL